MQPNHYMPVGTIAKQVGMSKGSLYSRVRKGLLKPKTDAGHLMLLSLDSVKALLEREKSKAPVSASSKPQRKRPPATQQADHLHKVAACLEVFFPDGVPVERYVDALVLMKALDTVAL